MTAPRIEIRYVDGANDDPDNSGYLFVSIDGFSQPSIFFRNFDLGNDDRIHAGIHDLVEKVYTKGFVDGERASKKRVTDLIEWASE